MEFELEEVGDEELRDEVPKGVQRFERDIRRPLIPRRRVATCSFHCAQFLSMEGIIDCATNSRTNVRTEITSDSKMVDVGSSRSSAASRSVLVLSSVEVCTSAHTSP